MDVFFGGAERLSPLVLVALGYLLKKVRVVDDGAADSLMKLVFNVFLPASIFYSLLQIRLTPELFILPAAGFLIALACYAFGFLAKGFLGMKRETQGSFLIACGATNQALFTYPFFLMYLGTIGLSYVAFYDVGQAVLSLTLAYYIAMRYGKKHVGLGKMAKKMLVFPVLWAFALSLLVNSLGLSHAAQPLMPFITMLHGCTINLVMLSLGLFLSPVIREGRAMAGVIFTRFAFALGAAFLLAYALNLQGLERTTVIIASAVPPAMLTLVYSAEEGLDVEYTSAMLSVCILIGLVYTPVLFTLLL